MRFTGDDLTDMAEAVSSAEELKANTAVRLNVGNFTAKSGIVFVITEDESGVFVAEPTGGVSR